VRVFQQLTSEYMSLLPATPANEMHEHQTKSKECELPKRALFTVLTIGGKKDID